MAEKLKECPFCGDKNIRMHHQKRTDPLYQTCIEGYIQCTNCGDRTDTFFSWHKEEKHKESLKRLEIFLYKMWNPRAKEAKP